MKILKEKDHYFNEFLISWSPENCLFYFNNEDDLIDHPLGHELSDILDKLQEISYTLNIPDEEATTCTPLDSSSSSWQGSSPAASKRQAMSKRHPLKQAMLDFVPGFEEEDVNAMTDSDLVLNLQGQYDEMLLDADDNAQNLWAILKDYCYNCGKHGVAKGEFLGDHQPLCRHCADADFGD